MVWRGEDRKINKRKGEQKTREERAVRGEEGREEEDG